MIIQCEEMRAIENLPRMLQEVRGIGVVLIGEGDLSQELGHPHPDAKNIERLIADGYRFLMPSTPRSFAVLEQGRKLAGRT